MKFFFQKSILEIFGAQGRGMNAACYQQNSNWIVLVLIPNHYGPNFIKYFAGGSSGQKSENYFFPFSITWIFSLMPLPQMES